MQGTRRWPVDLVPVVMLVVAAAMGCEGGGGGGATGPVILTIVGSFGSAATPTLMVPLTVSPGP